jgi:carboxyl-terminal processing protease
MLHPVRHILACTVTSLVCAVAAAQNTGKTLQQLPVPELQMLAATYGVVKESFVTPIAGESMILASIRGMLREIDPEGGEFFTEEETKAFIDGAGAGAASIGSEVTLRANQFVVVSPIAGGPAEAAGLRPGDVLQAIDGKLLKGLSLHQAVSLLRGAPGSKVALSIQRDCSPVPAQLEIERRVTTLQGVSMARPRAELAVLRIPAFRDRTLEEVAASLTKEWRERPFKGLVLDMRRNPGGLVESAVGLAAIFLPPQTVVAKSSGNSAAANHVFRADAADYSRRAARDPLADIPKPVRSVPLVVLVDEGTASGSEIVVAALKDHRRATIVGRKTFGRGSIQTITRISGGAIKYTSAYWESPSGARIHGAGVLPDEVLEPLDPQQELDAAVASLGRRL